MSDGTPYVDLYPNETDQTGLRDGNDQRP